MKRRDLVKGIGLLPLAGIFPTKIKEASIKKEELRNYEAIEPDELHTFESFIRLRSNESALEAANFVIQNPGIPDFNPLCIFGSDENGKSHLADAIGLELQKDRKFIPHSELCELFESDFKFAKKNNQIDHLKKSYLSNFDVLIFNFMNSEVTEPKHKLSVQGQKVLLEILKVYKENKKQIVIDHNGPINTNSDLIPELKEFFQSGLAVEIKKPWFEDKKLIAIHFAKIYRVKLTQDQIAILARKSKSVSMVESLVMQAQDVLNFWS